MFKFNLQVDELNVLSARSVELVLSVRSLMQFDCVNILLKAQVCEVRRESGRNALHPVQNKSVVPALTPDEVHDGENDAQSATYLETEMIYVVLDLFFRAHAGCGVCLLRQFERLLDFWLFFSIGSFLLFFDLEIVLGNLDLFFFNCLVSIGGSSTEA